MRLECPTPEIASPFTTTRRFRVTRHAAERYIERVDGTVSLSAATATLDWLSLRARVRPTPRRWMRQSVGASSGLRFLYPASDPRVCLLARGASVVTVLTRQLCQRDRVVTRPERREHPDERPVRREERNSGRRRGRTRQEARRKP